MTSEPLELGDVLDGRAPRARRGVAHATLSAPAVRAGRRRSGAADVLEGTWWAVSAGAARRSGARRALATAVPPLVAALLALLVWEAWVRWRDIAAYLVPAPSAVLATLADDPGRFAFAARTTLVEALAGLAVGAGTAFALAALMAHSRPLERALYPLALLVKVTPVIAVAPLFVIWFGFGIWPKVLIAALITFFPMLVNAVTGLRDVDPAAHEFLRAMRASRLQVFWRLRLPASLPYLFAALRISVPLSLIGAVVAEWMSGDTGIGQVLLIANGDFDTAALFAAVFTLALIAVALTGALALAEHRLLFWHDTTRDRR